MLTYLYVYISSYFHSEEGQGMAEYGLILALVAVALVAGFGLLKDGIAATLTSVTAEL